MKKNGTRLAILTLCIAYLGIANATLIGSTVLVARQYQPSMTTIESWTVTASSTLLELDNVYSGIFDINLQATSISIIFNSNLGAGTGMGFNGLTFTDVSGTIPAFTSFTLASTNVSGFQSSFLSFQENKLLVDLSGLSQSAGQYINLNIGFATVPVPEPTTMILLGMGLAGLALARMKKNI